MQGTSAKICEICGKCFFSPADSADFRRRSFHGITEKFIEILFIKINQHFYTVNIYNIL